MGQGCPETGGGLVCRVEREREMEQHIVNTVL